MAPVLGVIGGSGLYDVEDLESVEELQVSTPYGAPSDRLIRGRMKGTDTTVLFLPRHGRGHRRPPSAINFRANVCAMKLLGATHLISVSAVGSMKESIVPGHLVVVDQFIDLTKRRASTFFDEHVATHVAFADPVCPVVARALYEAAKTTSTGVHQGGTYVCIEGPQFSTRAESRLYRSWGVDVIGMTGMPEAKLAREAELPFALLAMATDYDCWHESEEDVTAEGVIATLKSNVVHAKETIRALAAALPVVSESPAARALDGAIMTPLDMIPHESRVALEWLLGTRRR